MAACAPASAFPPPVPTPGGDWSVQLIQTGGFAGVDLAIKVFSDAHMTADDRRSGRTVTVPVSQADMQELKDLLAQIGAPTADHLPSVCADCFIYDLEIISGSARVRIQADDMNLSESGAQALILFLGQIRDQALRSTT
jgi:hypothetical protein